MIFDDITDAIGHTPLVRLRVPAAEGVEVYAKLELQNLFGMKDRVAANIVLEAKRVGALVDGAHIVESSSGTMALGVALVGTALGHPVHIVTDPRIDRMTLAKLRALGCRVHVVEAMTSHGWQSARLERLERLMADLPGAFWPQQYSNPDNPGAYRKLAREVLDDLGSVDVLVGSVGSGGSLCGTSRALRESLPELHVVGVDCVGSALFDQPDEPRRLQSGLGNSLLPKNLDRTLVDEVHWLNDHEAFAATRALAAEQQIFAGNTSGSVYRVLTDVASRAEPGTRIVGIFPDRGDRYADTVYSDEYWAASGLTDLAAADAPEQVDYGTEVDRWSRSVNKSGQDLDRYLVFVEANTTGTGMLALDLTAGLGLRPVLLTGKPERYAGLAATGAEVLVCDTNSPSALRTAVQDRFRREELAGVVSTSDFYAPAVADLAAWLGLPRNPVEAVRTCRDKSLLRRRLAQAGVPQPRFAVLDEPVTADAVAAAVAEVGLPCVVKPVDDSGSNLVVLCHDAATVAAQAERVLAVRENVRGMPTARRVLVEQYARGPEFSVELFGWAGESHLVGVTRKSVTGGPHFVEHRHLFPAPLDRADADALTDAARRAVEAAGMTLGATHTEVVLTERGPAVVEVNPRLAGGMIPELIRLATGVQLLEQQLRVGAGLPPELAAGDTGYAGIAFLLAPEHGVLRAVDGVAAARSVPGVVEVTVTARAGATVRPPVNAYDRLGHVIARAEGPEEVDAALTAALGRIDTRIESEGDQ
ncbi:cysteine synthase A [Saccharothrix saharensis]|uniref:Cysteine synthase A n=1 Tax=Saccharothrix saharensis TaxID=571190 RepID=A0A543JRF6_9PSEU|nr:pyridoxal-phosphate dependent enzyme [Saccharothrix saharensis]TQM85420.1 cysteine synthase A [Saccharothrix saharensis]